MAWERTHPEEKRANRRAAGYRRRARKRFALGGASIDQIAARWAMWGNLCWMCGASATCTDHVKPLSKGGGHFPANLRPACRRCNARKGARWPFTLHLVGAAGP